MHRAASLSAAALASAVAVPQPAVQSVDASLLSPGAPGIGQIVVVMVENRSFDHLPGRLPSTNGRQAGLT